MNTGPEDIPDPVIPDDWEPDARGADEEQGWSRYEALAEAKHANKLAIHKVFRWIIPIAISLAFLGFTILLGVYLAHLVLPHYCRWLTPDEVQHIHSMIFSSVVGGAVAIFAKTYFIDQPKD